MSDRMKDKQQALVNCPMRVELFGVDCQFDNPAHCQFLPWCEELTQLRAMRERVEGFPRYPAAMVYTGKGKSISCDVVLSDDLQQAIKGEK